MASSKFELNRNFDRLVNDAVKEVARKKQREIDRLSVELKGKPLATAKARLKRVWEADGGRIIDPELTRYAELLVEGGKITFTTKP